MDLRYTPEEEAFRAEARAWLEANVPAEPLASGDTLEGFPPTALGGEALRRRAGRWCPGPASTAAATRASSSG